VYKLGDILLIKTKSFSTITSIIGITKAGNFKTNTKNCIINKNGGVRGQYLPDVKIISKKEAERLKKKWKEYKVFRNKLKIITAFYDWASLSVENISKVYDIIV